MHPLIVRHVVLPLHERLKRTPTFAWLARLERTQWMEPEKLGELQFAELRRHLEFAYRHTRYYRRLLNEHELPPHRIQSLADFRKVPVLTRKLLRENFTDLAATGVRLGRVQRVATGGSTGEPVTLLVDMSAGFNIALRHRAHRWFGLEPGAREIVLWGSPIEATRQDRLRDLRDWLINSRLISAFDLGESALAVYARIITKHRPLRLYGYASAIYLLAQFLEREGWRPTWRMHAVFTTAETLFDFQKDHRGRVRLPSRHRVRSARRRQHGQRVSSRRPAHSCRGCGSRNRRHHVGRPRRDRRHELPSARDAAHPLSHGRHR